MIVHWTRCLRVVCIVRGRMLWFVNYLLISFPSVCFMAGMLEKWYPTLLNGYLFICWSRCACCCLYVGLLRLLHTMKGACLDLAEVYVWDLDEDWPPTISQLKFLSMCRWHSRWHHSSQVKIWNLVLGDDLQPARDIYSNLWLQKYCLKQEDFVARFLNKLCERP